MQFSNDVYEAWIVSYVRSNISALEVPFITFPNDGFPSKFGFPNDPRNALINVLDVCSFIVDKNYLSNANIRLCHCSKISFKCGGVKAGKRRELTGSGVFPCSLRTTSDSITQSLLKRDPLSMVILRSIYKGHRWLCFER